MMHSILVTAGAYTIWVLAWFGWAHFRKRPLELEEMLIVWNPLFLIFLLIWWLKGKFED
jgi:hypothetical protein